MGKAVGKRKSKNRNAPAKQLTRKEIRKQKKEEKKQNKRLFFSSKAVNKHPFASATAVKDRQSSVQPMKVKKQQKKKSTPVDDEDISSEHLVSGEVCSEDNESISSNFSDDEVDAHLRKKTIQTNKDDCVAIKKPKLQSAPRPDAVDTRRRELQRQKQLEKEAHRQRIKQLMLENEEEDKVIARLEKKLKLNKTKDKNRLVRKMFNDGLDFALELCLDDEEERRNQELKKGHKKELQQQKEISWSDEEQDEERFNEIFGSGAESDEEDSVANGENDDEEEGHSAVEEEESRDNGEKGEEQYKEDIYGRKRDKYGNIVKDNALSKDTQKYIPPHQRAMVEDGKDDKQTQILERLHKQCKGLLNRLSEANLHKISTSIEELYMKNSRYNMNTTLTKLLQEALTGRVISNERMVQEHMVLLAYLHATIGSEIGAHFLQVFIGDFDSLLKELNALPVEDKRLNNVVLVLAYMYIFKIYEHRLLLEIIESLSDQLCEKTIECLLLIFQSVGFKLRKDDPLAFKQMMLGVQTKIAAAPLELKENLRLKFMVDILSAVKNNNINKIPKFDPALAENLRKRLKGMLRNDKYVVTLNITKEDLLRADSVGKWWVVGSAWSGNINDMSSATTTKTQKESNCQRFSERLLKLAKQQKMNTEERRTIFCIIMSAADYVEAFEKILHLALKDQRSIAYVVIHCCLNERNANPYYAHLALKFCNFNRKFQLAFQFAAWDRINDLESLSKQQLRNLARFLQHLILNGGLQLSVLKVVDFLQLNKQSFVFMKEITKGLLLASEEQEIYEAFERLAKNAKLQQFKQSIRLFLQHFLLKEEGTTLKLTDQQMSLLKKRVSHVDKVLAYVDL